MVNNHYLIIIPHFFKQWLITIIISIPQNLTQGITECNDNNVIVMVKYMFLEGSPGRMAFHGTFLRY